MRTTKHDRRFPSHAAGRQTPTPHDLLEALGPLDDSPAESQFCVFRSGRERFCLPVLDVEEVLDWPLLTKVAAGVLPIFSEFSILRGVIVPLIDIAMTEGRRPGFCRNTWWSLPCAAKPDTKIFA